jgi:hypothetical protein
MTNPFTTADITNMREAQEIHAYVDTAAYIAAPNITVLDEYGQPAPVVAETEISCAFVDTAKAERWQGYADIEEIEAEIYFTDVTPTKGGKFKIKKRFGQAVTNKTFEIIGIQDRGAFGYVCALKAAAL